MAAIAFEIWHLFKGTITVRIKVAKIHCVRMFSLNKVIHNEIIQYISYWNIGMTPKAFYKVLAWTKLSYGYKLFKWYCYIRSTALTIVTHIFYCHPNLIITLGQG